MIEAIKISLDFWREDQCVVHSDFYKTTAHVVLNIFLWKIHSFLRVSNINVSPTSMYTNSSSILITFIDVLLHLMSR